MWNPCVGETVGCECEGRNAEDPYTVALRKDGVMVGHILRTISCVCTALFLRRDGAIQCPVTGPKKYSNNLLQGWLELPCTDQFTILLITLYSQNRWLTMTRSLAKDLVQHT